MAIFLAVLTSVLLYIFGVIRLREFDTSDLRVHQDVGNPISFLTGEFLSFTRKSYICEPSFFSHPWISQCFVLRKVTAKLGALRAKYCLAALETIDMTKTPLISLPRSAGT